MNEGEASDAAISSEDIIGEENDNDGDLNEEEFREVNGVTKIFVGPKAIGDDKKREWVNFDVRADPSITAYTRPPFIRWNGVELAVPSNQR